MYLWRPACVTFCSKSMPEIPAGKPWWGTLYDPKTGLQKQWPQRWTEFGAPCGCMQVAGNWLDEAFLPSYQACFELTAPTLHPQSVLFCEPRVSVVHLGRQRPVELTSRQTWCVPVDKKGQQAGQAPSKTDEIQTKHVVSTACRPRVFQIARFKGFPNIPHIPLPTGHVVGTNEATRAPSLKNTPSWHKRNCP